MDEVDSAIMIGKKIIKSDVTADNMDDFHQVERHPGVNSSLHHERLSGSTDKQGQIHCPQEIQTTATVLATDIVYYYSNKKTKSTITCSHCKTLRRTVDELSEKHDLVFNRIVNKLQINRQNGKATFMSVAEEIFSDGIYNWGRVMSLFAFTARLGRYCFEHGLSDYVDTLAEYCGQFITTKLGQWIQQQGGWKAFDEYFPDPNATEEKWWRGLVFTAVGLGALATVVAVR